VRVAAHGYWAADQLVGELDQTTGGKAKIQAGTPVIEVVMTYPATQAIFERYGILYQADRVAPWETVEQAAAARGHWAADLLLAELNAVCVGQQGARFSVRPVPPLR
jgi:hypothetical protein